MDSRELLAGWGRSNVSAATVARPTSASEIESLLAPANGRLIARGLGRSYGDAAQCAGGTVLDLTALDEIDPVDSSGSVRVEGGVSFDALIRELVPQGRFVPVSAGTRFITVGGAIASDIHGKNHHVDGAISAHVQQFTLGTPSGTVCCTPLDHAEEFWATCGGMGLTGVVLDATMRTIPIETSKMSVDTDRVDDLDACLAMLESEHGKYRYSVAWVDALASGDHLGRAVLSRGDHARRDELSRRDAKEPLAYGPRRPISIPATPPVSLLNAATVAAFNELWFRKAPKHSVGHLESIPVFFHPLDAVGRWNVLYSGRGFTQYQFVVPFGAEDALRLVLERLSSARIASFLTVLKSFGPQDPGHLSFPIEGWTLALDLPLGTLGLAEILDDLDLAVAESGGRVYLTKDGRLRPELLAQMYPRLDEWRAVRDRLDPKGVLSSDLGRRLGLVDSYRPGKENK
ncbi:MAG: FAD-binding oxidoreductase [Acidimicrobiales bacterium]